MNRRSFLGSLVAIPAGIGAAALLPRAVIAAPITENTICVGPDFPQHWIGHYGDLPRILENGSLYIPYERLAMDSSMNHGCSLVVSNPHLHHFFFELRLDSDTPRQHCVGVSVLGYDNYLIVREEVFLELLNIIGPSLSRTLRRRG